MKTNSQRKHSQHKRKRDLLGDLGDYIASGGSLQRISAYLLCLVTIFLSSTALLINKIEGNIELFVALSLVFLLAATSILWLFCKKDVHRGPLYLILLVLETLGIFLLIQGGAASWSSLFWFLIFPPMLMFCLGLTQGSIAFLIYFLTIIALLLTPLEQYMAVPLPAEIKVRFLMSMVGSFLFSWGAELSRSLAQKALLRIMDRLKQDSLTDLLTGLGNRRSFYSYYNTAFLSSSAWKDNFIIALGDIDRFKNINDTYGHDVGDKVLFHVASILRSQCRKIDKVYRWGGEEFLLFMPKTQSEAAFNVLERIRKKIETTPYTNSDGISISITISFGYCEGLTSGDLEEQIAAADKGLYSAKNTGRNKVAMATIPHEEQTKA